MDYGIVAKMVQNDLCSKGIIAANVESAPMLVEAYLKVIGMSYTKDDITIISKVMTMNTNQITPCNPGSSPIDESCPGCRDCGYDDRDNDDDDCDDCDDCDDDDDDKGSSERAELLLEDLEKLFNDLDDIPSLESITNELEKFLMLIPECCDLTGVNFSLEKIYKNAQEIQDAVHSIQEFVTEFQNLKDLIEEKI